MKVNICVSLIYPIHAAFRQPYLETTVSGHIYILTDGINTKIGITTDFNKRMSTYNTHNANIQLIKSYPCDIEEAKRIETAIKYVFKGSLSGKSKEWFSVSPETVDRYVSTLLEKPLKTAFLPSMHGISLTEKAYNLKEEIVKLVEHANIEQRRKVDAKKEELAELFATCFGLGMPEHKLPPQEMVVVKDNAGVDTRHCTPAVQSQKVRQAVRSNRIAMPHDDHVWRYFHLVKLGTGCFVAVCTARVSMPYLKAISKDEEIQAIVELANEFGWYCTIHNDWSWHYPDKSALILYQPKTPVSNLLRLWDNSFRKWLIERQELLKLERFDNKEDLVKVIEDTAHDNTFPLDVISYRELCDKYFRPFWGVAHNEESDHWTRPAYEFLMSKWKADTEVQ